MIRLPLINLYRRLMEKLKLEIIKKVLMLSTTTELGLTLNDAEIIRTNSTGLVIYNPKNLAERIKGMKNKNFSREDKIKARLLYEAQSQVVN